MPLGNMTFAAGIADSDSGESSSGASVSAAVGGGTLKIGYSNQTMIIDASADATTGFTQSLASLSTSDNTTLTAAASTLIAGTDTTTVATIGTESAQDASSAGDTTVWSAAYSMALDADTTFATSYKNAKDADGDSNNRFEVSISRSLGGGASVYIDMANLNGDVDGSTDGTAFGFGTSVAF